MKARRGVAAHVVLALVVSLLTLGIGMATDAAPATAADRGVDFTGYCKARYSAPGVTVSAWHAWVGAWTAVTWRCRQSSMAPFAAPEFARIFPRTPHGVVRVIDHQIDVHAACRWQYGSRAYAKLVGQSWRDWRCVV